MGRGCVQLASVQAPASAQEGTAIVARPREVCESRSSKLVPPCSGPADQGRSNRDQEPGKFVHASQFRSRGAMTRVSRCADGVERGSLPPKKPMGTLEDSLLSNRPAACALGRARACMSPRRRGGRGGRRAGGRGGHAADDGPARARQPRPRAGPSHAPPGCTVRNAYARPMNAVQLQSRHTDTRGVARHCH